MKTLMARLNAELFGIHSQDNQDQPSPTGSQEESDDEDVFSRAFQEQVTLGLLFFNAALAMYLTIYQGESTTDIPAAPVVNSPPPSALVPARDEPPILPSNSNISVSSPPVAPDEPQIVPQYEETIPVEKRSSKRNATRGGRGRAGKKTAKS